MDLLELCRLPALRALFLRLDAVHEAMVAAEQTEEAAEGSVGTVWLLSYQVLGCRANTRGGRGQRWAM